MTPRTKVIALLAATFMYAIVRYNVFGGVAWDNVPVYILNKALSWTGLVLFGMSMLARETHLRRYYGMRASAAVLLHLILSLCILNPHYFKKFFNDSGYMNLSAELSMLSGAIGFLFLAGLFYLNCVERNDSGASLRAGWGRAVLWCGAAHVAAMGFAGWLTPSAWHGFLPPISLLSFFCALYMLYRRSRCSQ